LIYTPHFMYDVARGKYPQIRSVSKFGHNLDVDTGTVPETVWSQGGLWVPPTAARIHNVVSSDAADDAAGTGAQTVKVQGLDASWAEQNETLDMDGTTIVPTVNEYRRIFRIQVVTAGSGQTNAGLITATAVTDGTITAAVPIALGSTFMAVWTVPAQRTCALMSIWASINRQTVAASAMAEFDLRIMSGLDTDTPAALVSQQIGLAVDGVGAVNWPFTLPKCIEGPADIEIRARFVSDNNTVVNAGFDAIYERTLGS